MPNSLFDVLHRQRVVIAMPVIVSIGRQLTDALKHLHAKGIVHRDLNSYNIKVDENRTIKIGGFRFASSTSSTSASTSALGSGDDSESFEVRQFKLFCSIVQKKNCSNLICFFLGRGSRQVLCQLNICVGVRLN